MEGITNIKVDDQCYGLKLIGNLMFEDVVGPDSLDNVTRKEFLVRVKDVDDIGFPREADKTLKRIHKASGATIAITCSPEVMLYCQARMELWGTVDQVEIAESAIVREITKLYYQRSLIVPTILMQAPIYHNEVYVPMSQSVKLVGECGSFENLVKMEAESGAWIMKDLLGIPSPRHLTMRRLHIFGTREQVYRALLIVNEAVLEPYKPEPSETVQAANEHKNDSNVLGAETGAGLNFTLTNSSAALQSSLNFKMPDTIPVNTFIYIPLEPIKPEADQTLEYIPLVGETSNKRRERNKKENVQAAYEHNDAVLDHQLPVDSNDLIKEQTVKVGKEAKTEPVDYATPNTINDDELENEYDVFLKKIQSVKPMKFGVLPRKKNPWREYDHKWPTPRIYLPTSPAAYILTSHDAEVSPPNFTSSIRTSNPPSYSPRPTPPSYSPTSPAYMFTSHVYFPTPGYDYLSRCPLPSRSS